MAIKLHRPPHFYLDDTYYFISAVTLYKKPFLNTDRKRRSLASLLQRTLVRYNFSLYCWVILNNHYHLLLKIPKAKNLARFIQKLHSDSAIDLNKVDHCPGRKIWYQYWDRCIRSEKDFWTRFNYIHHNPIKHGYVKKMEDYKFSSYNHYLEKYGDQWIADCLKEYSIIDFTDPGDEF